MNRGPKLLGASESRAKKFYARKEYASLHRFPDPVAGSRTPKPHLPPQHFGLPVLTLGAGRGN